jgi:polyphosphate kinase 2 (PPK2 family)
MVKESPTSESWLSAEMEETLDDLFENEFSEPMLSDELRKVYKEKQPSDLGRRTYYENLLRLQIELIKLQDWVETTGSKVLIICEGRDSAGKGGVIKRIVQRLNPRVARVVALPKPSEREQTQWYFQRYVPHLPAGGEIVLFDRSWYNRAGVERVMEFATDDQVEQFFRDVPEFERMLVRSGIIVSEVLVFHNGRRTATAVSDTHS